MLTYFLQFVKTWAVPIIIAVLLIVGVWFVFIGRQGQLRVISEAEFTPIDLPGSTQTVKIGAPAPDFSLQDLDGKTYKLADFKGKKTFLYFWTTTCIFCEKEKPFLEKAWLDAASRWNFVGINVKESARLVRDYQEKSPYPFLILLDRDGIVSANYFTIGTPHHAFLDENGNLIDVYRGYLSEERLRKFLSL
jgi:peroxiredoxin